MAPTLLSVLPGQLRAVGSIFGLKAVASILAIRAAKAAAHAAEMTQKGTQIAAEAAKGWSEKRKAKYDALNQFEMQYDDQVNSTTTWVDAIAAIKAEIPKE